MMQTVKRAVRAIGAGPSVAVSALWPCRPLLSVMRKLNRIQLSSRELARISAAIRRHRQCQLLVFGLGYDSAYWHALNRHGRTVFLEDDPHWLQAVLQRHRQLTAFPVRYTTVLTQWQELLSQRDRLRLDWPDEVRESAWDVVLVDAPAGWKDDTPGRMQSIAAAPRLVAPGGDVIVHDCDRTVEQVYCDTFLPATALLAQVDRLRHYRVPASARAGSQQA